MDLVRLCNKHVLPGLRLSWLLHTRLSMPGADRMPESSTRVVLSYSSPACIFWITPATALCLNRVALDVTVDLSIQCVLKSIMCSVEGNQSNISVNTVCDTCCIHCIHCTVCFVIVLANNYVELSFVRFDEGFHNFLSTILCEVTRLRIKNCPFIMICCYLIESICTSECCRCSNRTFDYKDVCFFAIHGILPASYLL